MGFRSLAREIIMLKRFVALILLGPGLAGTLCAHDTWVQTNTNVVRVKDAVHVDLMLGNHGNAHRDFKLASKIDLGGCQLRVHAPSGKQHDLRSGLIDTGFTPKEGFWTTKFVVTEPGLHVVEHTFDRVVNHGKPVRSIRSGKTFFVSSKSLDRIPEENPGFERPLGHPLEIVPVSNPVTPMGPGVVLTLQVLHQGQPLAGARITFIPRGHELAEGFDSDYERKTDAAGQAEFIPTTGNYYLVVVHHDSDAEKGDGYESTHYTATLTVFVPELCPCDAE